MIEYIDAVSGTQYYTDTIENMITDTSRSYKLVSKGTEVVARVYIGDIAHSIHIMGRGTHGGYEGSYYVHGTGIEVLRPMVYSGDVTITTIRDDEYLVILADKSGDWNTVVMAT